MLKAIYQNNMDIPVAIAKLSCIADELDRYTHLFEMYEKEAVILGFKSWIYHGLPDVVWQLKTSFASDDEARLMSVGLSSNVDLMAQLIQSFSLIRGRKTVME